MTYQWELEPVRSGDSWSSRYRLTVRTTKGQIIGSNYLNTRWFAKRHAMKIIRKYERSLERGVVKGRIDT